MAKASAFVSLNKINQIFYTFWPRWKSLQLLLLNWFQSGAISSECYYYSYYLSLNPKIFGFAETAGITYRDDFQ